MRPQLQIIADENIALVDDFFSEFGTVRKLSGNEFAPDKVVDADVLLVRSVTQVNPYLLSKCRRLKFVGSATTGTDHIDRPLLHERNIHFSHAPGSNANSVVEYVLSVLASFFLTAREISEATVGIVGLGTIGARVARVASALGCSVIANDPPLEKQSLGLTDVSFVSLRELACRSDIVTLHIPLTVDGAHPTMSLIDEEVAACFKEGVRFINTSRGKTVTSQALRRMAEKHAEIALDVWRNEPTPDPELVEHTAVATPHIAGYSYDGKVAGTRMLREALISFLEIDSPPIEEPGGVRVETPSGNRRAGEDEIMNVITSVYDVRNDDRRFRDAYLSVDPGDRARIFGTLRKNYPIRRSFSGHNFELKSYRPETVSFLKQIPGIKI